jgi:hypothetical protein
MPFSNIDKPNKYFNTATWTGNGTSQAINVGFQPDLNWFKNRDNGSTYHIWIDSVRGINKEIYSNATSAEATDTNEMVSWNSTGYTVGSAGNTNQNGYKIVSWNWLGGGTGVSNTQGTLTATVSANTTSGFSICRITEASSYSGVQTFGHGLGVAPSMVIYRQQNNGSNWQVYHKSTGTGLMQLNTTNAVVTSATFFPTVTSTLFGLSENIQAPTYTSIAYCFADVKGFSKFGGYTGNGGTGDNGVFVYTGFKPAFVMFKATNYGSVTRWIIKDNKRNTYNVVANNLSAELAGTENTDGNDYVDFLSNGFKYRGTTISENINASGTSYIYMAFAENPFCSSKGIPTCAR